MLYLLSLPLFSGVTFYMPVNNVPHVVSLPALICEVYVFDQSPFNHAASKYIFIVCLGCRRHGCPLVMAINLQSIMCILSKIILPQHTGGGTRDESYTVGVLWSCTKGPVSWDCLCYLKNYTCS